MKKNDEATKKGVSCTFDTPSSTSESDSTSESESTSDPWLRVPREP